MKKFLMLAAFLSLISSCRPAVTPQETEASALEAHGDGFFSLRSSIKNKGDAATNMDAAAADYLKAFNSGPLNPVRLYKYLMALDFKYRYLSPGTPQEKKTQYEKLISKYEPYGRKFSSSREFNYSMAILWGRRGEITQDVFDASNQSIAEKIRKYAKALYRIDRKFQDYAACKILGRLNYKVPNVPLILTWPDRKKSRAYLEEMLAGSPDNTEGKMFLADTIWDTGDKAAAVKLYRQVIASQPGKDTWFYDVMAIRQCTARMKQLHIR